MPAVIRGLERVGGFRGKASTLAQSELYDGRPDFFKTALSWINHATPERGPLSRPTLAVRGALPVLMCFPTAAISRRKALWTVPPASQKWLIYPTYVFPKSSGPPSVTA